ncbi:MAG: hypothetical protein PHS86_09035 [Syntrophaceae bacterium]|nr:hypothetical protein [Syntrophaceae bacterium]
MSDEDRILFQLGRRGGAITELDDIMNPAIRSKLLSAKKHIENESQGGVPEYIQAMKRRFV